MNFKHSKNIQPSVDGMQKIFAICWSNNLMRLAVALADRSICLYDEKGERKERFQTKAATKLNKAYVVRDMAFSPDSTKLAIAQSDNIIFIYKLGNVWGDKKSICNKFQQNSPVTCIVWPKDRPSDIYFGLAEGKVNIIIKLRLKLAS